MIFYRLLLGEFSQDSYRLELQIAKNTIEQLK